MPPKGQITPRPSRAQAHCSRHFYQRTSCFPFVPFGSAPGLARPTGRTDFLHQPNKTQVGQKKSLQGSDNGRLPRLSCSL
ncbi:hypothetical protein JTE90_013041 [Oedothorax gibbosus]|uniref:Uncharacterized protein n=1 Tax=Oedothorax gibbosus TaxID=931172 RepID=A0AAV6UIK1_9ARAC|nr:hypothetical protein JTE90_013041 [Oedothorax gibbosus]